MKSAIAIALFFLMCSSGHLGAGGADASAGKEVFQKRCSMCHGADGAGNTPMAKVAKLTIPNLASKEVQELSDADLQKVITQGKDKMKPVKGLSETDLANLVAYVRTFAKK